MYRFVCGDSWKNTSYCTWRADSNSPPPPAVCVCVCARERDSRAELKIRVHWPVPSKAPPLFLVTPLVTAVTMVAPLSSPQDSEGNLFANIGRRLLFAPAGKSFSHCFFCNNSIWRDLAFGWSLSLKLNQTGTSRFSLKYLKRGSVPKARLLKTFTLN